MKKLYKLCLCSLVFLSSGYATLAQKAGADLKVGTTQNLLTNLQQQAAPTAANQKVAKPAFKLQIPSTELLDAKINFAQSNSTDHQTVMGEVTGKHSGSFYLNVNKNSVEGNIILKKEKKAYKYYTDPDGTAHIKEVDIDGVLCVDLENAPANAAATTTPTASQIGAAVANLQSFPGATGCVLLDFDGYNMPAGNLWNNGNAINADPSGMSDADIQELWEVVSEDYRPFNINITTSEAVFNTYARTKRMRCVITPTNTAAPGAGGVAYVGSFNWDNDVPCWVFITSGKAGGEASSHEVGHTLGLSHDGRKSPVEEYYAGQGDWAPIMGVGYYKNITQWSKGEYNSANNQEDDLSIMSGATYGLGYRTDDFGNSTSAAANLVIGSNGTVSSDQNKGIIERTTDLDFFAFNTAGGNITLNVNTVSRHGDLDVLVRLYNSSGTQIGSFDQAGLNATVTASLSAGKYYISVDGTGAGNPAVDGYSDYSSLGSYFISGTIPPQVTTNDNAVVTVYKDCAFGGYAIGLEEGDFTLSQLQARGISNDDISSLKVNYGFKITVYFDDNYIGSSAVFNADDDCLVDNGWNDNISSLKIRPDGVTSVAGTFFIQNKNSSLYMDVWGAGTGDGVNIAQGTYNGGTNQQFEFTHLGDGVYKIDAKHSGKVLDIDAVSKADGAILHQWTYVGGKNQQFILKDAGSGYYKLVARHSSKIVEVPGSSTANGTVLDQWTNHNGANGQWKFITVPTTPAFTTTIQAENYSAMAGVQTETTTDAGGGLNVGYIDNGDWMAYNNVTFPTTGAYLIEYRVASVSGGQLSVDLNAGAIVLGYLNVPATGGWQNWTTISHTVNVTAGTYNLGIFAQAGGWNINWIRITKVSNASAVAMSSSMDAPETSVTTGTSGAAQLELYPNPVDNEVTLNTNYELAGSHLKIFDATGIVVMEESNPTSLLDVNELGRGIYTLMLITKDNTKIVQRFVKR
ncbi:MAG TPA: carbohydrate-binding protein [Cytophagaceae bacterium]|nr:carbohydrate-binding protein [Cytophagaceae bacterium]